LPSISKSCSKDIDPINSTAQSIFPPEFNLAQFNQCIPERRTVLDNKNKTIAVCYILKISLPILFCNLKNIFV
jgi:hypothetical protein